MILFITFFVSIFDDRGSFTWCQRQSLSVTRGRITVLVQKEIKAVNICFCKFVVEGSGSL